VDLLGVRGIPALLLIPTALTRKKWNLMKMKVKVEVRMVMGMEWKVVKPEGDLGVKGWVVGKVVAACELLGLQVLVGRVE
jgi:hypothetical protein